MAPIKFENNIKEKLEERRLTPSDRTWAALQDKLDANTSKRSKKPFWWMGLAASFIGIILISTLFFDKEEVVNTPTEVVNEDVVDPVKINVIKPIETITNQNKEVLANTTKTEKLIDKENSIVNKKITKKQLNVKQNQIALEALKNENTVVAKEEVGEDVKKEITEKLSLEEQRIDAIVAAINKLDKSGNSLALDSEVDALLQEAQQEIAFNKLYKQAIKTVDANGLLLEVEEDLQQSFRNKVFKKLLEGVNNARTVYANRNN